MRPGSPGWLLFAALAVATGCARWSSSGDLEQRLLRPATPSPDSVTLEVIFVRTPADQAAQTSAAWQEVDEQSLSAEVRRELARNGFRAGRIGAQFPPGLSEIFKLSEAPNAKESRLAGDDLGKEPLVRRRIVQLRDGRRGEIVASSVYDTLPILTSDGDGVQGKTFAKAQCRFAVVPAIESSGQISVVLTPEVVHGDAKQQWTGRDGMFRLEMAQPKEIFEALRLTAELAPGESLLLGSLADRPGSLGSRFFSDTSADGEVQKLLLVRVLQAPPDDLFEPREPGAEPEADSSAEPAVADADDAAQP